jgi:hypothetical protein
MSNTLSDTLYFFSKSASKPVGKGSNVEDYKLLIGEKY